MCSDVAKWITRRLTNDLGEMTTDTDVRPCVRAALMVPSVRTSVDVTFGVIVVFVIVVVVVVLVVVVATIHVFRLSLSCLHLPTREGGRKEERREKEGETREGNDDD